MIKKILGVILVMILLLGAVAGCFSKESLNERDERIGKLQAQVADLEEEIDDLEAEKEVTYHEGVEDAEDRLNPEIEKLMAEITDTKEEIEKLKKELSSIEVLRDPSYEELRIFLLITDRIEREQLGMHYNYTWLFLKNAKKSGIKGHVVVVRLTCRFLFFAGFKTTDRGWIYIMPWVDEEVKLVEGESFDELNESSTYTSGCKSDDTIEKIMIFD